jgi:hypothetical protein
MNGLLAFGAFVLLIFPGAVASGQATARSEFISFEAAKPVIDAMGESLPSELKAAGKIDAERWSEWVRARDRKIRDRLDQGEEDTLTNLLRFGVTFTKEYRIDDEYLLRYGKSTLVNSFAEHRADDLIRALASPAPPEGFAHMRALLEKKGFSFKTPQDRQRVKQLLLANLGRMQRDFFKAREQLRAGNRFQQYQDRGISLDSNLWPDHLLDRHLRQMVEKGMLRPGSVRRVAIVGPGLDFVNKENGIDFYPPQTSQPFAVFDSLIRLGVADAATVELTAIDVSSEVNLHVERARRHAASGRAYTLQLPWNTRRPMSQEYRADFIAYWQKLGDAIAKPVTPLAVPSAATGIETRAVRIAPEIVNKITPVNMNIVFERLQLAPQRGFDLVIGTNIFLYYEEFEQSLARANIAAMLKPGGYLLSNDKLPGNVPSGLEKVMETEVISSQDPLITDFIFCYKRLE